MSKFHNPYHFVPVKKRTDVDKQYDLTLEADRSVKWGSHSHESYGEGLHSGRLVCRLKTETPIFIGGRQHDETEPKQIDHFMLDNEPAIPASTLRGLLSSIAEAASNSALRVLDGECEFKARKDRKKVSVGRTQEYFHTVDLDLLPFNNKRTRITPAELLFGFVQDEKENNQEKASIAFKGKVRLTNATLESGQKEPYQLEEVTLRILSSPKPPSPAMYFKPVNKPQGGYISKADLKPNIHNPQGRKFYLHHNLKKWPCPWETKKSEDMNQKNRVSPLRPGIFFSFAIQFDNLTDWELGLLCYAVRPDRDFRHKIGMGKPLGLGTVEIEPVALDLVDRLKRYMAEGFTAPRYAPGSFDAYRSKFSSTIDPQIANALKVLGNPTKVQLEVHTPQLQGRSTETETFKWFVANDVGGKGIPAAHQYLAPVFDDTIPSLPYLGTSSNPRSPSHHGSGKWGGQKPSDSHHNKPNHGNKPHHGGDKKPENKGGENFSNNALAAALAKAQDKKK